MSHAYLNRLGPTPLVEIALDGGAPIWAKLEFLNPSGSTKDRIARYILEKAWRDGRLRAGSIVVEASSGSTSIAMALACAQMGIRFVAVMPEGVSNERVLMIRAYGGEIRLTDRDAGIDGAIEETERLAREWDAFLPRQFENPENVQAHRTGTAREILDQLHGRTIDAVVSGVGTGGTLVGLYEGLREGGCPRVTAVVARPVDRGGSGADVECCSFSPRIPGVLDCASKLFRPEAIERLMTVEVTDHDALAASRRLMAMGFPVGPSSGLNFHAATETARRLEVEGDAPLVIVTVFPDRMERYFTTELFAPYR